MENNPEPANDGTDNRNNHQGLIVESAIQNNETVAYNTIEESHNEVTPIYMGLKRKRSHKDLKFVKILNKQIALNDTIIDSKQPKDGENNEPNIETKRRSFTKQISEYFLEEKPKAYPKKLTRSISLFNLRREPSQEVSDNLISVKNLSTRRSQNELNGTHFQLNAYNVRPCLEAGPNVNLFL